MKLFDANDDGRISYDEFNSALGVAESSASSAAALLEGAADAPQAEVIGPAARAHRAIASHPARRASRGTSHAVHVAPRMPSTWQVSGTLKVQLENGEEVEVDAAAYMAELKAEAQRLRAELSSAKAEEESAQGALATSLSAYVSKLPEDQLKALTSGITDDVRR